MDYKYTLDQVYKQQRPFKLNKDDLILISHGGYSKAASLEELSNLIKADILSNLYDILVIFDKDKITKDEFIKYIQTGIFKDGTSVIRSRFIDDINNLRTELTSMIDKKVDITEYNDKLIEIDNKITALKDSLITMIGDKVSQDTFNSFIVELNSWKSVVQEAIDGKLDKSEFASELTKLVSKSDFIKYMENGYIVNGDSVEPVQ